MAVVRINTRLKENILRVIETKYATLIRREEKTFPTDIAERVVTLFLRPYEEALTKLPSWYVNPPVRKLIMQAEGYVAGGTKRVETASEQELSTPIVLPISYPNSIPLRSSWRGVTLDRKAEISDPEVAAKMADIYKDIDRWAARMHVWYEQRDTLKTHTDRLLDRYATLSPALKEWPALWEFIPEDAKETHKRVVHRNPQQKDITSNTEGAEAAAPDVDLAKMTALAATLKVHGGE